MNRVEVEVQFRNVDTGFAQEVQLAAEGVPLDWRANLVSPTPRFESESQELGIEFDTIEMVLKKYGEVYKRVAKSYPLTKRMPACIGCIGRPSRWTA